MIFETTELNQYYIDIKHIKLYSQKEVYIKQSQ